MRIARVEIDGRKFLARLESDKALPVALESELPTRDMLRELLSEGVNLAELEGVAHPLTLDSGILRAPVRAPQKVLAIGLNYADHARETGMEFPQAPIVFVKTSNAIVGPGEPIRWRASDSHQVDFEAELAVVIGRRARDVTEANALSYVLGYTCCNDVSARDAQFADGQWVRGKSFDTFCPLGPWIVTADEIPDPQELAIRCRVDGRTMQESNTSEMIFGVAAIVSYLSRFVTLEPGDVIATGTPFGVGFARTPPVYLEHGNVVDVELEKIGVLSNPCLIE